MPGVPAGTGPVGPHTTTPDRGTRTSGLAGVVTVVLATLMALVAPMLAATVVPGTNGPIAFSSREHLDSHNDIYVMNAESTNPTGSPPTTANSRWSTEMIL